MPVERKKFTNPKVLLSLIKEGQFLQVTVRILTTEKVLENGRISNIIEANTRDKNIERNVQFRFPDDSARFAENELVEVEITLPTLVIRFNTEIISATRTHIDVKIPNEAWYFQRRIGVRSVFFSAHWFPAIIESKHRVFEVSVLLKNFSSAGYAAVVKVPSSINAPAVFDKLKGAIITKDAFLKVDTSVIHSKEVNPCENGFRQFLVGLTSHPIPELKWDNQNRRSISRRQIIKDLVIESLVDNRTIEITTTEASFSGFSCEILNNAVPYPPGSAFQLAGTSLIFRLQTNGEKARFLLTDGDQACRIRWMNFVISAHHKDISTSKYHPNELLRSFLEAGALPNELLERASFYNQDFMQTLAETSKDSAWFFRSINFDPGSSTLKGHASGVRLSDSTWFVGDVAGGVTDTTKISPTFLKRFLTSFKEFCLIQSPLPNVLGIWKVGHPYWKNFEDHLMTSPSINVAKGYFAHEKTSWTDEVIDVADLPHSAEITSAEYIKIKSITNALEDLKVDGFSKMLDFTLERFGSPLLRILTKNSGSQIFERKYFLLSKNGKRSLAIFTRLPLGVSFNQVSTSAYVFPLDGRYSQEEWNNIRSSVKATGLACGCPASSIRRVVNNLDDLYDSESNFVAAYLFLPCAFDFFALQESKAA